MAELGLIFILVIYLTLVLGVMSFVVYSAYLTHFQDPLVSTPDAVIEKLLGILPPHLRGRKTFYELGAGQGKVALAVARKFPRLRVVAVEKSKFLVWLMQLSASRQALNNLRVLRRDLFKIPLKKADIIYLYLTPRSLKKLSPSLRRLRQSALILSLDFPLPEKRILRRLSIGSHRLFLHRG